MSDFFRDIVSLSLPCFVFCLDSLLLIHMVANKPQASLRDDESHDLIRDGRDIYG